MRPEILIAENFIPPDREVLDVYKTCACGHLHDKVETPSIVELELSKRKHRWPELQSLMNDFLEAAASKVTEYEVDILSLFKMPKLEEVRDLFQGNGDVTGGKKLEINATMKNGLARIFEEWSKDLTGTKKLKKDFLEDDEGIPIYDYYALSGFSVGAKKTLKQIASTLTSDDAKRILETKRIIANANDPYFKQIVNRGAKNLRAKLSIAKRDEIMTVLRNMSLRGMSSRQGALLMHKAIGEGNLWHWNRIVRSEMVLASSAAFQEQSKAAGINYEKWSCGAGACWLCSSFAGCTWKLGEGPTEVEDTHPQCCLNGTKITVFQGYKNIEELKVGDYVYSHKGNLQRVTKIHKHLEKSADMVRLIYSALDQKCELILTKNHKVLSGGNWIEAGSILTGDLIDDAIIKEYSGSEHVEFFPLPVISKDCFTTENVWLYNLSVENDESYIADNIVVHNCLCTREGYYEAPADTVIQQEWTRNNPYDEPYTRDQVENFTQLYGLTG